MNSFFTHISRLAQKRGKSTLIVSMLAFAVLFVLGVHLVENEALKKSESSFFVQQALEVNQACGAVERNLQDLSSEMGILAAHSLPEYLQGKRSREIIEERFRVGCLVYKDIRAYAFFDGDGKLIASYASPSQKASDYISELTGRHKQLSEEASAGAQKNISCEFSLRPEKQAVFLAMPVILGGKVEGALLVAYDITRFLERHVGILRKDSPGCSMVLHGKGTIVYLCRPEYIGRNIFADSPFTDHHYAENIKDVFSAANGNMRIFGFCPKTDVSVDRLFSWNSFKVAGHDFKIMISSPYEVVTGNLTGVRMKRWALTLGVLAVLLGMTVVFIRHLTYEFERQSSERYYRLFNGLRDPIFGMDIARDCDLEHVVAVNDSACEVLGYTRNEMLYMPASKFLRCKSPEACICPQACASNDMENDVAVLLDVELITRSGRIIPVEIHSQLIEVGGNRMCLVVCRNISERLRYQEELEKYKAMISNMPNPIALVDHDYRYVAVNDVFLYLFNRKREDFLGCKVPEVLGEKRFEASIKNKMDRCFAGEDISYEDWFEFSENRKMYLEVKYHPLRVESGDITGIVVIGRDITAIKEARDALALSEKRYRSIVDDLPVLICRFLPDGTITFVNKSYCRYFNKSFSELRNTSLWAVIPEDQHENIMGELKKLTQDNPVGSMEHQVVKGNGEICWQRWTDRAIYDDDGVLAGYQSVGEDITEHKMLEEQLRQVEKMQAVGQLAGGIAHDFNNQLAGIMGFAEMIRGQYERDDKLLRYSDMIIRAAKRSADLTSQLLAFARKGNYLNVPVNLHALILDVSELLSHSIDKRIAIKHELDADDPYCLGDPTQLHSVFLNIGINAADAMSGGGELTFSTTSVSLDELYCRSHPYQIEPGEYAMVTVSDNGTGMDEDTIKRIFEPFFTTKGIGEGTGMGLAAVYGIVKNHKGCIEVESELGRGSDFRIMLPLTKERDNQQVNSCDSVKTVSKTHVLVVDDEFIVRRMASEMLENIGCSVTCCENGNEGVQYYRDNWQKVDLVLLDMVMPDIDGREVFYAMREINPEVKVILSSGFSIDGKAEEILNEGVQAFIQKPFRMSVLAEKIREIIPAKASEKTAT